MKKTAHPHVEAGEQYARDVIAGKISACKWVRLACKRHFKDKEKAKTGWPYRFDFEKAEAKANFMEKFDHVKGKWAAKKEPFILGPFQCFITLSIFGWVYKAGPKKGLRRFTHALIMMPRKNGKSIFAALIGLAMFADDGEFGAEVFSGATTEKQAWEVFGPARLMAERSPEFQEYYGVQVFKSNLHIESNGSKFEPMIGKPGDGPSPNCAIIDEYHEHDDDVMANAMETGTLAREQPLIFKISTAGDNMAGPCYATLKDLEKILEGVTENDQFFGIVYTIDVAAYEWEGETVQADDWTSEAALIKANPNYGISVDPIQLRNSQLQAIGNARKQGIFQIKHQNIWVGARLAYFNMKSWQLCRKSSITPQDFKGCPLFVGLDLASTTDIAAVDLLFQLPEERFALFSKLYLPDDIIEGGQNEQYDAWAKEGHLILTSGAMIDYNHIEADIIEIHKEFGIKELAYDKTYAQMMIQRLTKDPGITCVEVPQNVMHLSAPMKYLDGKILSGAIQHSGNPAQDWMISNVVAKTDKNDNVYPNKERDESKIDFAVAALNSMSRAMIHLPKKSKYDSPDYEPVFIRL